MYRSGLVDTLVTHANIEGFGLTPLSGDRRGQMPTLLKKPNSISKQGQPSNNKILVISDAEGVIRTFVADDLHKFSLDSGFVGPLT